MKVNKLSFQVEEEKDTRSPKLWFELFIDGESIEKYIGEDKAIPYYYFEEDTNDLPLQINYEGKKFICSEFAFAETQVAEAPRVN